VSGHLFVFTSWCIFKKSPKDIEAMTEHNKTPQETNLEDHAIDASKRKLLQRMRKGAYAAPVALAMMTTKATACSLTC
jgi:hypothetical protein